MRITRVVVLFLLIGISAGLSVAPLSVSAFGISPPKIVEDRLVPGSTLERTISLVQGNPEKETEVTVTIESGDMKDWITIVQGEQFIIPAGVQQFPMQVRLAVPKDAELGNYKAVVRVRTTPEAATEGGTVAIASGARLDVSVTVGDDIIEEFQVIGLSIEDVIEGRPLEAKARIRNIGNVSTGPDSATFELFDKFGNVRLAFATVEQEEFGTVEAFSERSMTITFPIDLRIAPGQYRGDVKLFNEEGQVVREVSTGFEVQERTLMLLLADSVPYAGGVLAVLVLLLVVFIIRRRRRKKRVLQQRAVENTTPRI